jgi:hypothetical protein
MSIVLQGSTSGSVTLQEPAVAGTTVLTLPATSGTLITTGSSGQSIPKAALPTGSVLQVVQGTYSTQVSSSSSTYADTNLSASITPSSTSSKILVIVNQGGVGKSAGDTDAGVRIRLLRDSTTLTTITDRFAYTATLLQITLAVGNAYLDSPSTTSSVTYKTQFACWNNSVSNVFVQGASGVSTITLLEIAA